MSEVEFNMLKEQVAELRRKMKLVSDWHDTVRSPFYKRIWWWLQGYRVNSLGTWYKASWNKAAGEKYNKEF
jgi:hypothetical protein